MARPSKIKPAPEAPASSSTAVVPAHPKVIDIDNFVRVRDSVYHRLSTIQDLIKSFSADYLRQTNLLLGEGTQMVDGSEVMGLDNALNLIAPPAGVPQPVLEPADGKKERKKRSHDPDAPKRPLTPYFLYMQTARPIIATDLGPDAAKGAVQEEGQRRWSTMSAGDKMGWDQAYQYNLRLYNARVHAYKQGGDKTAKQMSDEAALKYAEEHHIPMPNQGKDGATDQDQIAQQLQAPEPEEIIPPVPVATPAKTPKAAAKPATGGRKRKSTAAAATPAAAAAAADESAAKGSASAAAASPDKKRKRTSKAAAVAAAEEKPEPEPKKSGRKKAKAA